MNLLKKHNKRQVGFGVELFIIMFPAILYAIAAFACLKYAGIITPDPTFTEHILQGLKSDAATSFYRSNPDRAVSEIKGYLLAGNRMQSNVAKFQHLIAGLIVIGLILQICFALRVYFTRNPNTAERNQNGPQVSTPRALT